MSVQNYMYKFVYVYVYIYIYKFLHVCAVQRKANVKSDIPPPPREMGGGGAI